MLVPVAVRRVRAVRPDHDQPVAHAQHVDLVPYSSDSTAEVITSSGGPIRNRPSTRYSTRSTSGRIGLISWVTNTTAVPAARRRWSISCGDAWRWWARSSESSGSSHSSTAGSPTSAWATRSRCCSPPESRPTGASA